MKWADIVKGRNSNENLSSSDNISISISTENGPGNFSSHKKHTRKNLNNSTVENLYDMYFKSPLLESIMDSMEHTPFLSKDGIRPSSIYNYFDAFVNKRKTIFHHVGMIQTKYQVRQSRYHKKNHTKDSETSSSSDSDI